MNTEQIEQLKKLLELREAELQRELDKRDYTMIQSVHTSKENQIQCIREILTQL